VTRSTRPSCSGRIGRRAILGAAAALLTGAATAATPVRKRPEEIVQPRVPGPKAFMERAFEMRRLAIEHGDQPYGAVIVKDGRVVGEGPSAVVTGGDPTAHAEMQAIRDAARRLGTTDLSGCEMYGSSRACPMCAAGAYWANLARLVHGTALVDSGAPKLC
jgi:tRNA(Arg) A34 adenosine deaminase TadA